MKGSEGSEGEMMGRKGGMTGSEGERRGSRGRATS